MLKQPFFSQLATESAKKALSRMKICNVCRQELNMLNFRRDEGPTLPHSHEAKLLAFTGL